MLAGKLSGRHPLPLLNRDSKRIKIDRIPYGGREALPYGRTFPAACGGKLQKGLINYDFGE
ncbi:hypothetical protein ACFL2E_12285 [Thermodesulfobacteriota bacterium]